MERRHFLLAWKAPERIPATFMWPPWHVFLAAILNFFTNCSSFFPPLWCEGNGSPVIFSHGWKDITCSDDLSVVIFQTTGTQSIRSPLPPIDKKLLSLILAVFNCPPLSLLSVIFFPYRLSSALFAMVTVGASLWYALGFHSDKRGRELPDSSCESVWLMVFVHRVRGISLWRTCGN